MFFKQFIDFKMHAFLFVFLTTDFPFLDTRLNSFILRLPYNQIAPGDNFDVCTATITATASTQDVYIIESEKEAYSSAGHQCNANIHAAEEVPKA